MAEFEQKTANKEATNLTLGGNAAFHNFLNDFAHIEDPFERRRLALHKVDNADFSWLHVRTILIAGVGFLTDAYDIFAINMAMSPLVYVYYKGDISSSTQTLLKVSTSVGTVIGQFGFGFLADMFGRKAIYGTELIVMIVCCLIQVLLGDSAAVSFTAIFTFFRILMGIGIGGDYPLSSVVSSEFSNVKWRGAIMGAVFANQGWGQLLAGLVALISIVGYKNSLKDVNSFAECDHQCIKALDTIWRLIIGFGCVPACIALYFRLTIPESPRYAAETDADINAAAAQKNIENSSNSTTPKEPAIDVVSANASGSIFDNGAPVKATSATFISHFSQWKHLKILIGTAGSWFTLDVAYYGLGLNTASILQTIGYASSKNIYDSLYNAAAGNLILICAGSIPGYWCTVFTVDIIGRKPIQFVSFIILTGIFCILGFAYHKLHTNGLLAFYILAQFFQNFGPNTTTFIVPGECFPSRFRSSAHGISAALGKIGAIIAQTTIGTLQNHGCAPGKKNCFLPHVMEIFALFMLLGVFTTLLIPETKRKSLEDLAEHLHGEVNHFKMTGTNESLDAEERDEAVQQQV